MNFYQLWMVDFQIVWLNFCNYLPLLLCSLSIIFSTQPLLVFFWCVLSAHRDKNKHIHYYYCVPSWMEIALITRKPNYISFSKKERVCYEYNTNCAVPIAKTPIRFKSERSSVLLANFWFTHRAKVLSFNNELIKTDEKKMSFKRSQTENVESLLNVCMYCP